MSDTAAHPISGEVTRDFGRKRRVALAVPVLLLAYFVYVFFAFDIPGLAQRASMENARVLVSDAYSYKTHVTRNNRSGELTVAVEGKRNHIYAPDRMPAWITASGETTEIALRHGHRVTYAPDAVIYHYPTIGDIRITNPDGTFLTEIPEGLPDGIVNATGARVSIGTNAGRLAVTRSKAETFRYFNGWELFFFTLDSPYRGHSAFEILFGPQIDVARGNWAGAAQDFWGNTLWRHKDVAWAMFETILMAFLGTFGAAMVALPLAFLAARNFTPLMSVRFAARRVFDFVRGVDALIWTIVLARAFGPGPMTGALAILVTDTGSFGKIFSEALENVDDKQIEGIRSTGARPMQRYRFGVIPQVTPVLLSQILYFFESNARSATVIGAITGGGIGLMLTQAINTQQDWEQVTWYIVLILIMVVVMDTLSGWLRAKVIKGGEDPLL
ncbi:phosphonate ABC transporter, permease protein PhnE [Tropicimonas marinistellae]|uniref:phosphonate ABC transporter, permease protein PhnE n=1 Tax=Tropicimonas marinistellae TaxID=1739787 RepID=UPI0008370AC4|nr:phosphonate ABC transporter, permease protein PhnE [Tropicimonas marinistellae]